MTEWLVSQVQSAAGGAGGTVDTAGQWSHMSAWQLQGSFSAFNAINIREIFTVTIFTWTISLKTQFFYKKKLAI